MSFEGPACLCAVSPGAAIGTHVVVEYGALAQSVMCESTSLIRYIGYPRHHFDYLESTTLGIFITQEKYTVFL